MFADLPKPLQQQAIRYLESDNFKAAKELHDNWLQQHHRQQKHKMEVFHLLWVSVVAGGVKSFLHILDPRIPLFFSTSVFRQIEGVGE